MWGRDGTTARRACRMPAARMNRLLADTAAWPAELHDIPPDPPTPSPPPEPPHGPPSEPEIKDPPAPDQMPPVQDPPKSG
jgi:hypothetical protein